VLAVGLLSALTIFAAGLILVRARSARAQYRAMGSPVSLQAVRAEPDRFRPNTHMPSGSEGDVSGSIDLGSFSPGRDLVYIDDPRVWWESDHDGGDEDDHSIHRSAEMPLRRLMELVSDNGGTLEVHDAYRPAGIHNKRSLHKEGRALDVTCDQFSLEKLAKLCWAAGFDWVYYEANRRKGAHVHCSVRR